MSWIMSVIMLSKLFSFMVFRIWAEITEEDVEKQIEKLETAAVKLDEQIAEAAMDYQKLQELMEEKQAVDDQLSTLYEQWEELSLEMEEGQS